MEKEDYMRRAIILALKGTGSVNPNPLVGAVIVKNGRIIGEGYHEYYGGLHAERNAFKNCSEDTEGASMYVTLEPCCHYGKTPPCTEAIIEHKIKTVYIGSKDPNTLVGGKGIKILKEHGINVETGILKEECDEINKVFFHYITTKMPYVTMKFAMTLDGKIATKEGLSKWITSDLARENVHKMRNSLTGIMVGINTVLADNPMLNCRIDGGRNPVRIICDSKLRIPMDCNIVNTAKEIKTIVATLSENEEKKSSLREKGIIVINTKAFNGRIDLKDLMKKFGEDKIDGILLEGGGTLNYSALEQGIVSHIMAYVAPKIFGGDKGYTPVAGEGISLPADSFKLIHPVIEQIGSDILLEYDVEVE